MVFPEFDLAWLLPEAKKALFQELDFKEEGRNADRLRHRMSHWLLTGSLIVPQIYWDLTSQRVLTMSFEATDCKINDKEAIQKMKIDPKEVGRHVTRLFGEMIFGHGFLHTDPHPGNVFICKKGNSGMDSTLKKAEYVKIFI